MAKTGVNSTNYAGVNVNPPPPPHPGTRWGLVGKRRGFDRNRIPEGVGDWEIFVFNLPQGRGFGWGFVVSHLLWSQRLFISKINSCAYERSSRGECFCYLNLVFCHWNLSHLLSKSGAIHKMNIHLQLKMYTFIFRRCLLFIFRPFYELVEMNLMHEKIFYTLEIMEWKTFFQSCGFSDLYAEQYAKLFEENRYWSLPCISSLFYILCETIEDIYDI